MRTRRRLTLQRHSILALALGLTEIRLVEVGRDLPGAPACLLSCVAICR
jgi:hypothetical protein